MSTFTELKTYFNDKFNKLKEAIESKRMQTMLHQYFDMNGAGLNEKQIKKVNDLLRKNIVLTEEDEIDKFTTDITTLATFNTGREHLRQMRKYITQQLDNNKIIKKCDACLVSRNIIIKRPSSVQVSCDKNGNHIYKDIPEKTYVVSILPNTFQVVFTRKYNNEPLEKRKNIDNTINLFTKVKTNAYSGFSNHEM